LWIQQKSSTNRQYEFVGIAHIELAWCVALPA
jgi:hypothetical protein